MQQRFAGSVSRALARRFSGTFTYFCNPGESLSKRATVIPGTFIGPELINSVMEVLKAAKVPMQFDIINDFSFDNEECRQKITKNPYLLVGNLGHAGSKYVENIKFYKALELSVHMTHLKTLPNVKTRHGPLNMIVIRENLEGEYSGIEHEVFPGVFESLKVVTREKAQRVCTFAFEHSLLTGRKKVTCVHKANIMKMVDGLFLEIARETAKKYPTIQFEEMIVDNTCMQLTKTPQQFDVMLMPNLYGSIISSLGAGLVGGAGVTAGTSFGPKYRMFEPGTRKSGTNLTGRNVANPTGLILASINMLRSANLPYFGELIKDSLVSVYTEGKYLTEDVGGKATSSEFTQRLIDEIRKAQNSSTQKK